MRIGSWNGGDEWPPLVPDAPQREALSRRAGIMPDTGVRDGPGPAKRYFVSHRVRGTRGNYDQALIDSVEVALEAWIACAWRWIICSMKLYDELAFDDVAFAVVDALPVGVGADVIETTEPSA
ncbi:MAG: hypothetical protein JWQ24_3379 [Tardiphaga sp.]|nr:hypothetical protein [Tardiphaga sp.]